MGGVCKAHIRLEIKIEIELDLTNQSKIN